MNIGYLKKLTVMQSCSFILVRNMQDADIGELGSYYNILLKQCLGFKTQQNAIRQLQSTAICLTQVLFIKVNADIMKNWEKSKLQPRTIAQVRFSTFN